MKLIISLVLLAGLAGCGSAPKQAAGQFCHTKKTVETDNGSSVSSKTTVICSDDPVDRIVMARTGISSDCGEFRYLTNLRGTLVERRTYACKKFDGTWEIVPAVAP